MFDIATTEVGAAPTAIPGWLAWAVPIACVVAAIVLIYALHRYGGRGRALRRLAAIHGLTYTETDPAGLGDLRFATFGRPDGVRVSNVLTMRDGDRVRARAFDYACWDEHESGRGRNDVLEGLADEAFGFTRRGHADTTRVYTAPRSGAVVQVDAFLPSCAIRPTTWLSRAFEAVGVADLDFESEEFNRGWDVRCADHRFANLFVDAQLIALVIDLGPDVAVETFGNYVLFTAKLRAPAPMVDLLRAAAGVPSMLDPLVRQEYPSAAAMEARSSLDAWASRPDGRGGLY